MEIGLPNFAINCAIAKRKSPGGAAAGLFGAQRLNPGSTPGAIAERKKTALH